jgi:hypothetical protein
LAQECLLDRSGTDWGQNEPFPAEHTRIIRWLVYRLDISPNGADIRLRLDGLASLVRDPNAGGGERRRAA